MPLRILRLFRPDQKPSTQFRLPSDSGARLTRNSARTGRTTRLGRVLPSPLPPRVAARALKKTCHETGPPGVLRYVNAESMAAPAAMEDTGAERLDVVFRAQYERIARVIGRVIHDQARAEELAVEVFLKWWRNPRAQGTQAEGWLYRTAVREALDELRRQTRRHRFERLFGVFREAPATPEDLYSVNSRQQEVRTVLASLNRRHTALLLLRSEGLSYQEIAGSLDIHPNYVGSLLARAHDAFRKEYIKRYGNES